MKTVLLAILTACLSLYDLPKTALVISKTIISVRPDFFAPEPKVDFIADPELVDSYKAKVVQSVFDRLKNARGDFRTIRPVLRFVKQHGGVGPAFAQTQIRLITMEEKAYDICASMGKDSLNALAIILSHELIHVYEKHEWELFFATDNKNTSLADAVLDKAKDDEIQADYLGGFLAYQAGFETFGINDKLIDKIYSDYRLSSDAPNYPTKDERKTMAKQSAIKLNKLHELFEMANFLTVMEQYDDALEYYLKVSEEFESREIYNNLGVISALAALNRFAPTENSFYYPIMLDVNSRLGSKGIGDNKAVREEKLLEAIDFFKKAQQYDSFYPIAYVNEGCAHALLGISQHEYKDIELQEAERSASIAIRLSKDDAAWKSSLMNANILLGILKSLENDAANADKYFDVVLNMDSTNYLAILNKNTFHGIKNAENNINKVNLNAEVVEALPPGFNLGKEPKKAVLGLGIGDSIFYYNKLMQECTVVGSMHKKSGSSNTSFVMLWTIPNYSRPTVQGISIGDAREKVMEKYGTPSYFMSLGNGSFLRYIDASDSKGQVGVIFQFDEGHHLVRWGKYRKTP